MSSTETPSCPHPHCIVPHEDVTTFLEDGWCGKVYNPEPRPKSDGHEALFMHRGPKVVTVEAEFGANRVVVEIPRAKFDLLVKQITEGAWPE